MKIPTQKQLNLLFDYDPKSGKLFWKIRKSYRIQVGDEAGWDHEGYRRIEIDGKSFASHHIIWMMLYGEWPLEIDHIDGDGKNNRIQNLRCVSHRKNMMNVKTSSRNKTGVMGVSWYKRSSKWVAQIVVEGKKKNLGYFSAFDDAVRARRKAENFYNYHQNHGRVMV